MNRLLFWIKRYKFFLLLFALNLILLLVQPTLGRQSFDITKNNLLEMLTILPPIFILLGLLDVWVERETMMKYMGEGSGPVGAILAFVIGSAAAGPLYAAFPIAGVLLKKGVRLTNVFIFIGAWSTTKLPMLLFEASNLGLQYMLLRWTFNVIGIIIIAFLLEKTAPEEEKATIYANAKKS